MLPPVIGGIQAAFGVGTKCVFFFSQCKTSQIFCSPNLTNFALLSKYCTLATKLKFSGKCENKIVVSTLTALLLETPKWEAALSGGLANKPIQ